MIVIAKRPVAGRVKTRLTPPLSPEQASRVASAALADTLAAVTAVPATEHLLAFTDDGEGWTPDGWRVTRQPEGGLDVRLAAAFDAAAPGPTVLVGMDTPQLRPDQLTAFDPASYDACLGLADDGGFWAIGFRDPSTARSVIPGVVMSTERTGADQLARLHAAGLHVQLLDTLTDVDTIDTARAVAALAPHTRFAAALAAVDTVDSVDTVDTVDSGNTVAVGA